MATGQVTTDRGPLSTSSRTSIGSQPRETSMRLSAGPVGLIAGSARGGRENITGRPDAPGASQAIESWKQQSSSAAGGGLTAGIGADAAKNRTRRRQRA